MFSISRYLLTILSPKGSRQPELKPWQKGNSWLLKPSILPEFTVIKVFYKNMYTSENISSSITDISFVVTKV